MITTQTNKQTIKQASKQANKKKQQKQTKNNQTCICIVLVQGSEKV